MQNDDIYKTIREYFDEYVFGFIFKDLQSCINAKANYTVALALMSYTDFLGGLINGTLGIQGKSKEQFQKALEYFEWNQDKTYYKRFKVKFKDIDFNLKEGDIYTLFRCGLAHEYFIKGDSFVHNNFEGFNGGCIDDDAGIQIINDTNGQRLRFHTNAYFRDFKNACNKYYEQLADKNNETLRKKFLNALERIKVRKIEF